MDRWLVVGLGNPESEYGGTRHNVGADVVHALADRFRTDLSANKRVGCEIAEVRDGGERVVLARPMTYMNESGGPVRSTAGWYKIPAERTVVVHDDLDLEVGAIRLKRGGGSGGHNGLKDIARRFGTQEFLRVRVGIGRPTGRRDPVDHVLSRFGEDEREEIDVTIQEAGDAILGLVHDGLEPTQNRYHNR
ncbi:MAG: aminoacyl-tRNA hydrolase [Actinobacteria bacterium]|nr:aminoacyl-tRNA hydrolase [Actinomycetota bacterium]